MRVHVLLLRGARAPHHAPPVGRRQQLRVDLLLKRLKRQAERRAAERVVAREDAPGQGLRRAPHLPCTRCMQWLEWWFDGHGRILGLGTIDAVA